MLRGFLVLTLVLLGEVLLHMPRDYNMCACLPELQGSSALCIAILTASGSVAMLTSIRDLLQQHKC